MDLEEFRRSYLAKQSQAASEKPKHWKARGITEEGAAVPYPNGGPFRPPVPDEYTSFLVPWDAYAPIQFEAPFISDGRLSWTDPVQTTGIRFNELDGAVDRRSFTGKYVVGLDGRPKNPMGRTGIVGRGILGRWGPNQAADPVVTRFFNGKLQFVSINRKDGGGWAIPGGMVEGGQSIPVTLAREFGEEALNSLKLSPADRNALQSDLNKIFDPATLQQSTVFRGYVDDPRNTDNAWIETTVANAHLTEAAAAAFTLEAGSDAANVRWMDVDPSIRLYASHREFIKLVARRHSVAFD